MDAKFFMALAVLTAFGRLPTTASQPPPNDSTTPATTPNPAASPSTTDSGSNAVSSNATQSTGNSALPRGNLPDEWYEPRPRSPDGEPSARIIQDTCGEGKTCVGSVPGCTRSSSCRLLATFSINHDQGQGYYRFELMGEVPSGKGYVAVGLSLDDKMGDDSVVECVIDSKGKPGVFMSWDKKHDNDRLTVAPCDGQQVKHGPIIGCNVTLVDGKLLCNFYLRALTKINGQIFDLDRIKYFILQAVGHSIRGNYVDGGSKGNIGVHSFSFASRSALTPRAGIDEDESSDRGVIFLKLHGVFMIIAWIVLVPNAHFFIRYMRESWKDITYFGFPHAVFIHTTVMCIAAMMITAAVTFGIWYSILRESFASQVEERAHTILGSIVIPLFVLQMILGTFRPEDDGQKRRIVNLLHFFLGSICYFASVILILRAHKMTTSYFPCSSALLMIVWVLWSVVCHAIASVQIHRKDKQLGIKTYRSILPWPLVAKVEELTGRRFRLNVFAFHAAGACIVSTLLILPYLETTSGCTCKEEVCLQYTTF